MSKLVIVESPAKAKTIKKYLGGDYEVIASMGHVRDLPKARLCVDVKNDFKPKYAIIKGKEKLVSELKEAAEEADTVYLATDPDREGEAISWHLAYILGLDEDYHNRVTFNEITKTGITEGMAHPRSIDQNLVNAQQARRILDRLVGYSLSPFLAKTIRRGLSAGRVQSVALRIIVDREEEIRKFKPEEYWSIDARLTAEAPAAFSAHRSTAIKTARLKSRTKSSPIKSLPTSNPPRSWWSPSKRQEEQAACTAVHHVHLAAGSFAQAGLSGEAHDESRAGALRRRGH